MVLLILNWKWKIRQFMNTFPDIVDSLKSFPTHDKSAADDFAISGQSNVKILHKGDIWIWNELHPPCHTGYPNSGELCTRPSAPVGSNL